ncbi:Glycogen synthase [Rubripirellula amarantea]|uniref:Glycogen synthase n=1 Tax=Rubripirellula amarantea TaxID=2527999 RepID=A0A5C5WG27_9BACT|nr:glycosyltransferase [Rubripirellula amarantea]TWT49718.1 Glycogen synthase [Rubripirellula amarantea]
MKILFLHNYYQFLGGEDLSFNSEVRQLRGHGHEVVTLTRDNRDMNPPALHQIGLGKAGMAARTLWSHSASREIDRAIKLHRPDIMHCNNLFPQLSASVYRPARLAGVPVVQALRNYRYFCANSFLFRDGKVCEDCLSKSFPTSGIRHACYRDDRLATSTVVAMQWTHRTIGTWRRAVDAYFTPSEFARSVYVRGGFDPNQVHVKPNFIDPDPGPGPGQSGDAIFVGRLSQEKGLDVILRAWKRLPDPPTIQIVGDGPLREQVITMANENPRINYVGHLSHADLLQRIGDAKFLVMPSVWYETFGRTIAESFSRGTPVLASRLGAMEELVDDGVNGFLFTAGVDDDLAKQVLKIQALSRKDEMEMRQSARDRYLQHYTEPATYTKLMEIYDAAETRSRKRRGRTTVGDHRWLANEVVKPAPAIVNDLTQSSHGQSQ